MVFTRVFYPDIRSVNIVMSKIRIRNQDLEYCNCDARIWHFTFRITWWQQAVNSSLPGTLVALLGYSRLIHPSGVLWCSWGVSSCCPGDLVRCSRLVSFDESRLSARSRSSTLDLVRWSRVALVSDSRVHARTWKRVILSCLIPEWEVNLMFYTGWLADFFVFCLLIWMREILWCNTDALV